MLYLLRHESRPDDPSFETEIKENGQKRADTVLVKEIEGLEIDKVYSSPFIRCLQTVKAYTKKKGEKIKVDYRISEQISAENFVNKEIRSLSEEEKKEYNVDIENEEIDKLVWPEEESSVSRRVEEFLKEIEIVKENVLICTHERIIREILLQKTGIHYGYHHTGVIYPVIIPIIIKNISSCFMYLTHMINKYSLILPIISLKEQCDKRIKYLDPTRLWNYMTTKKKDLDGC